MAYTLTENQVKNQIIQYLMLRGALVLRVNSGATQSRYTDRRGRIQSRLVFFVKWWFRGLGEQRAGCSDLIFLLDGRAFCVETKRPGKEGNVTEYQRRFLEAWQDAGGVAIVASKVDDVVKAVES